MKVYAVRIMEDKQAVGFFWADDYHHLVALINDVIEPEVCEYQEISGPGGLAWEGHTIALGVDRGPLDGSGRNMLNDWRALRSGISPVGSAESFFYDGECEPFWLPVYEAAEPEQFPPFLAKRSVRELPPPPPDMPRAALEPIKNIVYFIKSGDHIKIGVTSGSVSRRLHVLATGHYEQLEVLATIDDAPGPLELELHQRFAALRVRGEWFKAAPELLAYIETIKGQK